MLFSLDTKAIQNFLKFYYPHRVYQIFTSSLKDNYLQFEISATNVDISMIVEKYRVFSMFVRSLFFFFYYILYAFLTVFFLHILHLHISLIIEKIHMSAESLVAVGEKVHLKKYTHSFFSVFTLYYLF